MTASIALTDGIQAAAAVAICVATIYYAVTTQKQLEEVRKANAAAERASIEAREALRANTRPWMLVESSEKATDYQPGAPLDLRVRVRNYGNSLALEMRATATWELYRIDSTCRQRPVAC